MHLLFMIDDLKICTLAREAAEREQRGKVEPRAGLMRKLGGDAELKHRRIFDFQIVTRKSKVMNVLSFIKRR